jgi:hypothetical protein
LTDLDRIIFGERIVGYYTSLAKAFKSIPVAVFASEIIQFTPKDGQGWVFRTVQQWEEIGFSLAEVTKVRDKLKKLGLLEEKNNGGMMYRIMPQSLSDFIAGKDLEVIVPAEKVKVARKTKKLNELIREFRKAGLPDPNLMGYQARAANDLIVKFTEYEIARCWRDIVDGKFGGKAVRDWLSFNFLVRHDVMPKWKKWSTNGKKQEDNSFTFETRGRKPSQNTSIASPEVIEALDR